MVKDYIIAMLKYGLGALMLGLALSSLYPWYLKKLESSDGAKSLPSMIQTGQAIKLYEQDWGKLPPPKLWIQTCSTYKPIIPDPTYENLTKITQPNNPGWAMNGRMQLTIGKTEETEGLKSSDLPGNTILIAPSFDQTVFPTRNGQLPDQPMSSEDDTPTQHGLRLGSTKEHSGISGLYLLNNGSIKELSLDNAQALLRLRPIPPAKKTEVKLRVETKDAVKWDNTPGVKQLGDTISIKEGQANSPLIPINSQNLKIILEVKSETLTPFTLKANFYNKYKMPINVETISGTEGIDGKPIMETELTSVYGAESRIYTTVPIATEAGTKIAFNPSYASAYPITTTTAGSKEIKSRGVYATNIKKVSNYFDKGTKVTLFKDFTKTWIEKAQTEWKKFSLSLDLKDLPPGTTFINLGIENKTYSPLQVRDIKVKRENTLD